VPEVRCKQPAGRDVPPEPKADEWVDWLPPTTSAPAGVAVLSKAAAEWIVDVLGVVRQEKGLRKVEHDCLDAAEKKGLIQQ
jgi:hypothetical protein